MKNQLPLENSTILSKNRNRSRGINHYTTNPERKKIALEKRAITRFHKKDEIFENQSKKKQARDKKLSQEIENILPYDLDYTISKLENDVYLNYLGKSKNYTMIKEDIRLYKSVMVHTEDFLQYYGGEYLPFSCRVQLIGKFKLNVAREYFCRCGIKLKFDRVSQEFTHKGFCRKCMLTPTNEEFYKYKFPECWESKFEQHKNKMGESARVLYINTLGMGSSINIGRNEKSILDYIELKHNVQIDRNFTVIGYKPDGYCHETNTVYEVYEPYHLTKTRLDKDKKRQENIMNTLKCRFVIIYDKNPKKEPDFQNLRIETHEVQ